MRIQHKVDMKKMTDYVERTAAPAEQPCCTEDGCPIVYTVVPAPGTDKQGGEGDADV